LPDADKSRGKQAKSQREVVAAGAGYRVGYDDGSPFCKEYKRLFGEPPMRKLPIVRRLTQMANQSAGGCQRHDLSGEEGAARIPLSIAEIRDIW
jgi:hypothetical protein